MYKLFVFFLNYFYFTSLSIFLLYTYICLINNMLCVFNLLISINYEYFIIIFLHTEKQLFFIHCKIIKNEI